jgi:transketolase
MLATRSKAVPSAVDIRAVRKSILDCLFESGGGHFGGSLSVADLLLTLFQEIVQRDPRTTNLMSRDRVILSKGHAAAALYAVLKHIGLLQNSNLADYGKYGARLEGHPDMTQTEGVDFSSGSLGQGVSVGIGMAIVLRQIGSHAWVIIGDGECQEGQVWEAALLAARYKLTNLHVIVDLNGAQEIGWQHDSRLVQEPAPMLAEKWESFGWAVHAVDGHDRTALSRVFHSARDETARPTAILAKTIKGKGVKIIENDPIRYHCTTLDETEYQQLVASLYD